MNLIDMIDMIDFATILVLEAQTLLVHKELIM